MKRFTRLPLPALVVAVVALVMALGGSAYAAIVITGKNVRNGTLVGADIKNKSLAGKDIKNDSLGRIPIKEERLDAAKLGKVKSATDADGVAGTTARHVDGFSLDDGQSKAVTTVGPISLTARCRTDAGDQIAEIVVQTNQNHSAMDGAQKDTDLNVGETPQLVAASAASGTPAFDQESAGAVIAPDGTELVGQELYAGTSVLGQGGKCRFGGTVWVG
jgi:hypothetical protein